MAKERIIYDAIDVLLCECDNIGIVRDLDDVIHRVGESSSQRSNILSCFVAHVLLDKELEVFCRENGGVLTALESHHMSHYWSPRIFL